MKKSSILSLFLILSVLTGIAPFKASAQTYTGTVQIPSTSVVPDYSQSGGYSRVSVPFSDFFPVAPSSLSTVGRGSFSNSLSQKTFGFSAQNINVLGGLNHYSYATEPPTPAVDCNSIMVYPSNSSVAIVSITDNGDGGAAFSPCVPVGIKPPTPENTEFVASVASWLGAGSFIQTYQTPPLFLFTGGKIKSDSSPGKATVESISDDPDNVKVTFESSLRAEYYAVRFQRFGNIVNIANGDFSGFDPETMLYKNGQTYFIQWATDWTGAPSQCWEGGCMYTGDVSQPQLIQLSTSSPSATNSIVRPRNSEIIFTTEPKCGPTNWDEGFWETRISNDCVTYGLSADGRIGTANYHTDQKWSNGWGADLINIATIAALTVVGANFGAIGTLVGETGATIGATEILVSGATSLGSSPAFNALAAVNLAALQQIASLSGESNLGTVETSNSLGVGNWTWSPLPELPQASCGSAAGVPAGNAPDSNLCGGTGSLRGTVDLRCYGYDGTDESWGDCNSFKSISDKKWEWGCGGNGYRSTSCDAPYKEEVLPPTAPVDINNNARVPTITTINPNLKTRGGPQFPISVTGTNFVVDSKVKLNGSERQTTFVSATQLTAIIPASDLAASGTFPITVTNPNGRTSNAVDFTVAQELDPEPPLSPPLPPAVSCSSFSASPSTIPSGEQTTLSWTCSNATSCSIDNGVGQVNPPQTSAPASPTQNTTYTLSCTGPGGGTPETATTTVTVNQPPLCVFSASPSTIVPPQSSSLSWNCNRATSCSIDNGIGAVNKDGGFKTVNPSKTTTYTLSCSGPGNSPGGSTQFQTTVTATNFNLKEVAP